MLSHLGYVMCTGRYAVYLTDDGGHELYANDAEGIAQLLDKLTSRTWELAEAQYHGNDRKYDSLGSRFARMVLCL